ncbi:MAG: GTP-binding protein [candidate division NC10 bacterium CSP1-5]|nr:MAG: GTP-binding protein [candidate division NC10 bacterium CSP1-5]
MYMEASRSVGTLLDPKYQQEYRAPHGGHGQGKKKRGRDGADVIIRVPLGTVITDQKTGRLLGDLTEDRQQVLVARGGRGGRGNAAFATSTRRAPRIAEEGRAGEERTLLLELKLLADVGLVGVPNAGKSTLLRALTAAQPKIADYPFTTLVPNLGVLDLSLNERMTVADIPGLIAGASGGAGLGLDFLRHIERVRLVVHVLDVSEAHDPLKAFEVVEEELRAYRRPLTELPRLVAANKIDLPHKKNLARCQRYFAGRGIPLYPVSALTGAGVSALKEGLRQSLRRALGQRESGGAQRAL